MRDWVLSHPATVQGLAGELAPLATAAGLAEKNRPSDAPTAIHIFRYHY